MHYIITLDQDNLPLSLEEFKSQNNKNKIIKTKYQHKIITTKKPDYKRLSLTKKINKIIKTTNKKKLIDDLNIDTIKKLNLKEYKITFENIDKQIKTKIINKITKIITKAKIEHNINLKKPKNIIEIIKLDNKIYITQRLEKKKDNISKRNNKNLPEKHPTATKPKITKAMINISEIKKGTICDPFCGSGGFLIEARKLKLNPIGIDINKIMLKKARLNCNKYIKNYKLALGDATNTNPLTIKEFLEKPYSNNEKVKSTTNFKITKIDAVITDMPYGKNSKITQEFKTLLTKFLNNYKKYTNTFIIGFQKNEDKDPINFKKLKLKKTFQTDIYIHKSMTKRIIKLKKIKNTKSTKQIQ